jgi:hypothetical protein
MDRLAGRNEQQAVAAALRKCYVTYIDDGAGGTVPDYIDRAEVRWLCTRPQAMHELVALLDSEGLTESNFKGRPVRLGYVALDVLLAIAGPSYRDAVFMDFGDDGLWSNVRSRYYFPPDAHLKPHGRQKMRRVQRAWAKLVSKLGEQTSMPGGEES